MPRSAALSNRLANSADPRMSLGARSAANSFRYMRPSVGDPKGRTTGRPGGTVRGVELPRYEDLPVRDGAPPGSAWGVWGDPDHLGCLNLLTPERAASAAARCVRSGRSYGLNLDFELPDPPLFGRGRLHHEV